MAEPGEQLAVPKVDIEAKIPRRPRKQRRWGKFWVDTFWAYTFLLPTLAVLGVFVFYPVLKALSLSFYEWDMISPNPKWVGIGNYTDLLQDDLFWKSLGNTFYYVIGSVPITIVIALAIALLLNSKINFRGLFRLAYFMPYITSTVAITMVWRWLYHDRFGLFNYILGLFDIDMVRWLMDPKWAMPAVIILSIWRHLGYDVVIFLAGLQNIDEEVYEAARVDGAEGWQLFRYITWPLLSPTTFFILIISIIGSFKVFTEIFVLLPGGGPLNSAMTAVYYVYEKGFGEWQMGYASAAAYVLFFIIFAFTLVQMYVARRRVHY